MNDRVYLSIAVMALVTYFIRLIPFTLIRREIKNIYIRSFLYYVPYVTLSVMTFPAILSATQSPWSAWGGFLTAAVMAYLRRSLLQVALGACVAVFVLELFLI